MPPSLLGGNSLEYMCSGCNYRFELIRNRGENNDVLSCPRCQQDAYKVLTAFCHRNATPEYKKFQESADEKMFYADRHLNEDKSLDPYRWLQDVAAERSYQKDVASGKIPSPSQLPIPEEN